MPNFFDTLVEVLKADERFFTEDGTLLRNKVYESALNMDVGLIGLLLRNAATKKRFFAEVNDMFVFDKVGFGWVVNNRQFLPDSYTRFKNRIGLTDARGDLISASNDVVLSFPYKDCVLEGGQSRDDQKRDEVFYNTILAPDEVDRLLYPKVLAGAKRYTASGIEESVTFDESDNLIIKGNNLLAIASLLKRYEGRVKCIYIDPPYNTGGAANTFAYNNRFNHSTWLVFMKNRLEIAKRLLDKSGVICIAIDDEEYAHLKILCDELFGGNNYIGTIIIQSNPRGRTINSHFATCHEYALFYAKNISFVTINFQDLTEKQENDFNKTDQDGRYRLLPFRRSGGTSTPNERPNSEFALYYSTGQKKIVAVGGERIESSTDMYSPREILRLNHIGEIISEPPDYFHGCNDIVAIFPIDTLGKRRVWRWSDRAAILAGVDRGDFIVVETEEKLSVQLKDRIKAGRKPKTIWGDSKYDASTHGTIPLKKVFGGEKIFSYPKSIHTVKDTIKMLTVPDNGDIILDFFAGSGTTAHAVFELNQEDGGNRQFILCEQMDYVETVTLERLLRVIKFDDAVVYVTLAECNHQYLNALEGTTTDADLTALLERVLATGFISSKVNPAEIAEATTDFEKLSVEDKRRFIIELLDKNMLYVNLCDLDDEEYSISDADKAFTRSFYGLEGNRA